MHFLHTHPVLIPPLSKPQMSHDPIYFPGNNGGKSYQGFTSGWKVQWL